MVVAKQVRSGGLCFLLATPEQPMSEDIPAVHPGSFCGPPGTRGKFASGRAAVCSRVTDSPAERARWRASGPAPAKTNHRALKKTGVPQQQTLDFASAEDPRVRGAREFTVARLAAEVEELIYEGAALDLVRERISRSASSVRDAAAAASVRAAADLFTADFDRHLFVRTARAAASANGLTRVGAAGDHVDFNPAYHRPIGPTPRPGDRVFVIRPGYTAEHDTPLARQTGGGTTVVVVKADVIIPVTTA